MQYQTYRAKYDDHAINKYDWANVEAWKKEKEAAANENYRVYRESIRENYDKILQRNNRRKERRLKKLEQARSNA